MPICERCGCEHDGSFGSGRFCSSYCSASRYTVIKPIPESEADNLIPIPKYVPYYVSDDGKVYKKQNGMYFEIKQGSSKGGYKLVTLAVNGKKKRLQVHRLVMISFCPCENSSQLLVNHKDENASNNNLSNLEWCDAKYNVNYDTGIQRMVDKQSIPVLCETTGVLYKSLTEASKQTGIYLSNISACCNGRLKSAGGYVWRFYEES